MNKLKKPRLTLEQRTSLNGVLYVVPFYIGFLLFFLTPMIKSVIYSLSDVTFDYGGVLPDFVGIKNYNYIFNKDLTFKGNLIAAVSELFWKTPVILIMSLLLAMLANRKTIFKGLVRSIFFLPVIISSGVVLDAIRQDGVARLMMEGSIVSATGEVIKNSSLTDILVEAGLNQKLVTLFQNISANVFEVMFNCGIPMLIFISSLQGISSSLYEAASVEGATAWDSFWKITLPMIAPTFLINLVYIIIDSFSASDQPVMRQILDAIELIRLGEASAMVWVFCGIIAAIFAVFFIIFNKLKIFEAS